MKVNIIINESSTIMAGWDNISENIVKEDVKNVKSLSTLEEYDDGEIEELRAYGVLEYLKDEFLEKALENWIKKLSINGVITISSLDILEVAHALTTATITVAQASGLIYNGKNNCFSRSQIIKYLEQNNFSIERVIIDNMMFSIKGKKNE